MQRGRRSLIGSVWPQTSETMWICVKEGNSPQCICVSGHWSCDGPLSVFVLLAGFYNDSSKRFYFLVLFFFALPSIEFWVFCCLSLRCFWSYKCRKEMAPHSKTSSGEYFRIFLSSLISFALLCLNMYIWFLNGSSVYGEKNHVTSSARAAETGMEQNMFRLRPWRQRGLVCIHRSVPRRAVLILPGDGMTG